MAKFWVAALANDKYPNVQQIRQFDSRDEALTWAVQLVKEIGTVESLEQIVEELEEDGHYRPEKYSDWSVAFGQFD